MAKVIDRIDALYADGKRPAQVGDVVMGPGNVRAIVIAIKGTFVTILGIGTNLKTGETFVLSPRFIHDCPAIECSCLEKQVLNL